MIRVVRAIGSELVAGSTEDGAAGPSTNRGISVDTARMGTLDVAASVPLGTTVFPGENHQAKKMPAMPAKTTAITSVIPIPLDVIPKKYTMLLSPRARKSAWYNWTMITLTDVQKSYRQGETLVEVLRGVTTTIDSGERVAIVGASGSGKSTLLAIIAGMETADAGEVLIGGRDLRNASEADLARFRNTEIAVVFQSFELVPSFSALENVMLPLDIRSEESETRARAALERVGLTHRLAHLPGELSGGEAQRVAIARAIAQGTPIIVADEPTGNLDAKTGADVIDLLFSTIAEDKKTLILVTHDERLARRSDRILELADGKLRAAL